MKIDQDKLSQLLLIEAGDLRNGGASLLKGGRMNQEELHNTAALLEAASERLDFLEAVFKNIGAVFGAGNVEAFGHQRDTHSKLSENDWVHLHELCVGEAELMTRLSNMRHTTHSEKLSFKDQSLRLKTIATECARMVKNMRSN